MLCKLRRERAGRDQPRSAGRSPWTGDDAPARIARRRNEIESLCRDSRCCGVCLAERSEQEDAVRRRPDPFGAIGLRDVGELYQRAGMGMAEGQADAECERAVLLPMPSDRFCPRSRRGRRCGGNPIRCRCAEGGNPVSPFYQCIAASKTTNREWPQMNTNEHK